MSSSVPRTRENSITKTSAIEGFCLTIKDLEALSVVHKPNPRAPRSGAPMSLYLQTEVEALALQKWGNQEGLDQERQKRHTKRLERAKAKAATSASLAGSPGASSPAPSPAPPQPSAQTPQSERRTGTAGEPAQATPPAASASKQALPGPGRRGAALPQFVLERIRNVRSGAAPDLGQLAGSGSARHVLYWMRTGLRGHENPALDVAAAAAERCGLPLVVAAFLLRGHTYPTARRYQFWLQGLRDTQAELRHQGLELLVHLDGVSGPQQDGWAALASLAASSALTVTEEMPVSPYAQWTHDLARDLPPGVSFWAVDTACLYPMQLTAKAPAKAYIFRSSSDKPRRERIAQMPYTSGTRDWSNFLGGAALFSQGMEAAEALSRRPVPADLGWEPLDLCAPGTDIPELLRQCPWIDQSVAAVTHMQGGSQEGYARWELFRRKGLDLYAAHRNNAMKRDGVSRLSAYHHYGMISPFKISRDLLLTRSNGASKYLDEFFTWREVAHAFCFRSWPELESTRALPNWAQQTLERHAGDPRHVKTAEQLEAAASGDAIWDAMQHQLNVTGELHNNLRMKWGKAVMYWIPSPDDAIKVVCRLNHKMALDGCDPCSYGGILWCFGLFDQPKNAESTPVSGVLRRMPTSSLANRLNWGAYRSLPVSAFGSEGAEMGEQQPSIRSFFSPKGKKQRTG